MSLVIFGLLSFARRNFFSSRNCRTRNNSMSSVIEGSRKFKILINRV